MSDWRQSRLVQSLLGRLTRALEPLMRRLLARFLERTDAGGQPNVNELWLLTKDIDVLRTNVKNFGFEMARELSDRNLQAREVPTAPPHVALGSKPTTQADLESDWVAYWCDQLGTRPAYHRKLWELCYVLQALSEGVPGFLSGGARGIGFGCGREPLPSLMAKLGHDIVVTDLGAEASIGRGWAETGQHMGRADDAYHEAIVDRATFDQRVSARAMDMNRLDRDLDGQFDFCWSVCALEHLGSIDQGLDFIENSLRVLRPGGVAVHTTEFNYAEDSETIDHWPTVLFQPRHFEQIAQRLERSGFEVARLDFDVGDAPLDRFIDVPPYLDGPEATQLKLAIDGFRCTCFGLIVRRPA